MSHTIVVAGLGRCGSSMLMQMLHLGGVPCVGDWPAFEDPRARHVVTREFVQACAGQAVKVLDPHRTGLPGNVRVVWLDRDRQQQAESHAKFLRLLTGVNPPREQRRKLPGALLRDTHAAMALIGSRPLIRLRFEEVLRHPLKAAELLAGFVGVPMDCGRAAGAVRARGPECAPGLDMELALMDGRTA